MIFTLHFLLNRTSEPGQSLWLCYCAVEAASGQQCEATVAMEWRDAAQWGCQCEVAAWEDGSFEYGYELRQESNGIALREGGSLRRISSLPAAITTRLMVDSWRAAGALDEMFSTSKALQRVLPARGPFTESPRSVVGANHSFQLRMAAVPLGLVPCLMGNVSEIGDWDGARALPLVEVAADLWQCELYLPCDWVIQYKYGLYDPALKRMTALESGENRFLKPRNLALPPWVQVRDESYRREVSSLFRGAGVAVPVFSLRSAEGLGIGEFADLKRLADWAKRVGLKLIQILPISDTTSTHDWTDSYPYSAISVFALHPIYLRLTDLTYPMAVGFQQDLATARELLNRLEKIDHVAVLTVKTLLTRQIFAQHHEAILEDVGFQRFLAANRSWLIPYAVFCVKRDHFGTADFSQWQDWAVFEQEKVEALAVASHPEFQQVAYHLWLQYELDQQLAAAVEHLHRNGLLLKGDLPIGIDRQSVDGWVAPELFQMAMQTGAPPDDFAVKGQNWGFPTYNWQQMQRDGYRWWRSRFVQLSRYFDVYRIDHILGFFRIWQIPYEQVEGIMGYFEPALPIQREEILSCGIVWDFERYCRPFLSAEILAERFGTTLGRAKAEFLEEQREGFWQLRAEVATQRKIATVFARLPQDEFHAELKENLFDCVSEVLFFEVAGSQGSEFHPRYGFQATQSFQALDGATRGRLNDLYNDYFYRRQEDFWQARAYEKLPAMRAASAMLLCGEDLGMVPACVPGVLNELGILALEIQRMPKVCGREFAAPADAPYLSVVSPSTHDTSTLRGWWREDPQATARYAREMLGRDEIAAELAGEVAAQIIVQHLESPAMWAIFPLQDLLAIDEALRHPEPDAERINVPAIVPYDWCFRLHVGLEQLLMSENFNQQLWQLVSASGR